jgi:hypothetical protein
VHGALKPQKPSRPGVYRITGVRRPARHSISQTRINTANYFLASENLSAFASRVFKLDLPRYVWVILSGALAFLLMLTDVLSYLLKAWPGKACL